MVINLFQHDSGNKNNYNDVKITDNCRGGTSNLTKAGSQQSRLRPCAHYSHPVAKMIIFSLLLKMSYAHFATTVVNEHDVYRVPQKTAIFFYCWQSSESGTSFIIYIALDVVPFIQDQRKIVPSLWKHLLSWDRGDIQQKWSNSFPVYLLKDTHL